LMVPLLVLSPPVVFTNVGLTLLPYVPTKIPTAME
jgi:hypothetical protein